ncbi:MAG: hypothetical protein MJZ09_05755 [Bacteroidales bacterium]|nr:hypothetical protein [Bacteroidales bacterium]
MSPKALIATAGVIWLAAGVNVVRMGVLTWADLGWSCSAGMIIGLVLTFMAFGAMFFKLSQKNVKRIHAMPAEQRKFYNFMTLKSYLIMIFMISLGVYLRHNPAVPRSFISFFYVGLGSALSLAGIVYFVSLFKKDS